MTVAEHISRRARRVKPLVFLREFYTAQRAELERKRLFGKVQERKKSGRLDEQ